MMLATLDRPIRVAPAVTKPVEELEVLLIVLVDTVDPEPVVGAGELEDSEVEEVAEDELVVADGVELTDGLELADEAEVLEALELPDVDVVEVEVSEVEVSEVDVAEVDVVSETEFEVEDSEEEVRKITLLDDVTFCWDVVCSATDEVTSAAAPEELVVEVGSVASQKPMYCENASVIYVRGVSFRSEPFVSIHAWQPLYSFIKVDVVSQSADVLPTSWASLYAS